MNQPTGLTLGTTLYSMTPAFHGREYSFTELVRKVATEKLGPGLEVVGFQSFRGFPDVSDAAAEEFQNLIAETGLKPSCLGINADIRLDPDKPMTDDESVVYHERQLVSAAKLGFPIVRYQYPAGPNVIRRLLPLAEKLNVKLGLEIHAPHHAQHPVVLEYREMYAQMRSPFLGFIPDFGACARAIPPSFFVAQREKGVPEELIELATEHWFKDGEQYERRNKYVQEARAKGFEDRLVNSLLFVFGLFSQAAPESWSEIMPEVIHIHGKFFDFDEHGDEVAVDYARVLPVFVKGGYNGFMSSEFEGHMWNDEDGFVMVRQHQAMVCRILARAS